jgi:hypothetical protein
MINEPLENIPRCQLLNYVEQLRKFVSVKQCSNTSSHIRPKKKTNFLYSTLQPDFTPGIGFGSRSSYVDLLEEDSKKGMS